MGSYLPHVAHTEEYIMRRTLVNEGTVGLGSMADLGPLLRAGHVPCRTEPRSVGTGAGATVGHRSDEAGLRGHSVGEFYPYRVVGKGDDTWEVHRNGCGQALVGMTCDEAHKVAGTLSGK